MSKKNKLFKDMTYREKLNHLQQMIDDGLTACNDEHVYLADIVDMFDIWGPWMLTELRINSINGDEPEKVALMKQQRNLIEGEKQWVIQRKRHKRPNNQKKRNQ